MKLTGKARAAFFEWLEGNHNTEIRMSGIDGDTFLISEDFGYLSAIIQNALIVQFLDEQGVLIGVDPCFDYMLRYNRGYEVVILLEGSDKREYLFNKTNDCFDTRPEATAAAIEKANEILNERLK